MTHSDDDDSLIGSTASSLPNLKSHHHSGKARRPGQKDSAPRAQEWRISTLSPFIARCEPLRPKWPFTAAGLSVLVSQWIRKGGRETLWDSVIVHCEEDKDGTLTLRVIVSNPDWDQPLQIACIRSRPGDAESLTPLACNLDHEELVD